MTTELMVPLFTLEDAERAGDEWGFNCGPAAVATMTGVTLDELRPHLGTFEQKRYTNPTLMFEVLKRLGVSWKLRKDGLRWPNFGLVRIQWEGPWTAPGVPIKARYRHSHWIGSMVAHKGGEHGQYVFDINCLGVGGWVPSREWSTQVVPWLLSQVEPKASGAWHPTHVIELQCG
jgi:hypothetical protein